MKRIDNNKGYIALISAILISVSLLTLVAAVSLEGYFSRFSILESEQKEMSAYLAESCFNTAVLKISQNAQYVGGLPLIKVGDAQCKIVSVSQGTVFASNRLIRTQGVVGDAYTNLQIEIDPSKLPQVDIVSWVEVGSF
jgi:hypothetical protein